MSLGAKYHLGQGDSAESDSIDVCEGAHQRRCRCLFQYFLDELSGGNLTTGRTLCSFVGIKHMDATRGSWHRY